MRTDLAIVVVHWNVPRLLAACLASIARERAGLRVETIVVDCASPSQEHREATRELEGVRLIELPENRGYAAGCNAGIVTSESDAILFLNPDTELLPGALETLLQTLDVAWHVAMVAPLLLHPNGTVQSAGYRFPGVANVAFDLFPSHARLVESPLNGRIPVGDGKQPVKVDYALGAALLARRSALDEVGMFDESFGMYCEEIDLARRLAEAGWTALLAPAARVVHHGGQSTRQRPEAMREALWLSRARYYERWGAPRDRWIIRALVEAGMRADDRRASDARRAANRRIRERFRSLGRDR